VTTTELGQFSGVQNNINTQLSGKQDTITGGASTVTTTNLTPSLALVSDASGKIGVSTVSTQLLQSMVGMPNFRVVVTDTNSRFTASSVGTGNLNQLTGVVTNCETARMLRFDLPTVNSG
jgi:CO/xanthine dehydrogenase Mo-binding subunit